MLETLLTHRRAANALGFLICAALLGGAYYLQFAQGLEPCPLCIFQRVAFFALGLVFLVAALHGPRRWGAGVYAVLVFVAAVAGAGLAIRQLWLQSLPADQVPACGPALDYMLQIMPLWETVRTVLSGSGECAEVQRVFGVAIPAWSLAAFVILGFGGVVLNGRRRSD